ncbi:hypothetical protein BN938_2268 [Mucinivorans hirudinis]|uniref:Uncharacterized protein n=1 Tax=Mucinivorans hirudinis TaxID=1433126 RepID=A0A060R9R7_9BACT|nr:hypothetical protein BN938_2268 [Mucinivorans hirudinis]
MGICAYLTLRQPPAVGCRMQPAAWGGGGLPDFISKIGLAQKELSINR